MTTLYIHGFASTGATSKVDQLREILGPDEEVIAPTLTHCPFNDIETLCDIIESSKVKTVVGSSLGGFYAIALAQRYDLRVVLINPALDPATTLEPMIGTVKVYGTNTEFTWGRPQLRELDALSYMVEAAIQLETSELTWPNVLILLAEKDELLDSHVTAARFSLAKVIMDPNEDHRFGSMYPYAEEIRRISKQPSVTPDSVDADNIRPLRLVP